MKLKNLWYSEHTLPQLIFLLDAYKKELTHWEKIQIKRAIKRKTKEEMKRIWKI